MASYALLPGAGWCFHRCVSVQGRAPLLPHPREEHSISISSWPKQKSAKTRAMKETERKQQLRCQREIRVMEGDEKSGGERENNCKEGPE